MFSRNYEIKLSKIISQPKEINQEKSFQTSRYYFRYYSIKKQNQLQNKLTNKQKFLLNYQKGFWILFVFWIITTIYLVR